MRYQVRRRSGTLTSTSRVILDTADLRAAQARYNALAATLRQGRLELVDTVEDQVLAQSSVATQRSIA